MVVINVCHAVLFGAQCTYCPEAADLCMCPQQALMGQLKDYNFFQLGTIYAHK